MSGLQYAEEGRKADADTHLAAARSQNTGNGISGDYKRQKDDLAVVLFAGMTKGRDMAGVLECMAEKWYSN